MRLLGMIVSGNW
jgi:hypothetical protein